MRILSGPNCRACLQIAHYVLDLCSLALTLVLLWWYSQTLLTVIEHLDVPQVVAVTEDYIDVQWHNRRLLDCPTEGTPSFFTPYATAELPSRPVASGLDEQTFIRRYFFPAHLLNLHHAHARQADPAQINLAELRITVTARCNPLWPTTQIVRVPFRMPAAHSP